MNEDNIMDKIFNIIKNVPERIYLDNTELQFVLVDKLKELAQKNVNNRLSIRDKIDMLLQIPNKVS